MYRLIFPDGQPQADPGNPLKWPPSWHSAIFSSPHIPISFASTFLPDKTNLYSETIQ
jgi:hypothetical protein